MTVQPAETTLFSLSNAAPEAPEERRDGERLMTLYRVGSLLIAGERELCLIKNISAGGMMVRAFCPIDEGTRISVELKCGQPIAGTVSWARDIHVGIRFDAPIDVIQILAASPEGLRPRLPRIEVESFVTVREGANIHRLRVTDISQGGMKVCGKAALEVGSDVVTSLAGIAPLPAVVRWTHADQVGIVFNRLLPLPALVDWLRAQRAAG